jgi:hypothetical protein
VTGHSIQFDLAEIPKDAKIKSATLELTRSGKYRNPQNSDMNLYRITTPWDELSANWFGPNNDKNWTTPGGDAVGSDAQPFGSPYASNNDSGISGDDIPPKFDWDVTQLVSDWVSGKFPNYGMLIVTDGKTNLLHFASREDSNSTPTLKVKLSK